MADLPLVRVRLKYPDVETLIERFAPNVTRGGIFLASRDPRPVGATIRFEVSLLGGTCVLAGEGRVTWIKVYDPMAPTQPHGMGVSFTRLDAGSREMFRRLVERREIGTARRANTPSTPVTPRAARTSQDLVAPDLESMDEAALRRTTERARTLSADLDNVESLLLEDGEAPPDLNEALAGLSRFLPQPRRTITPARTTIMVAAGSAEAAGAAVEVDVDLDDKDGQRR